MRTDEELLKTFSIKVENKIVYIVFFEAINEPLENAKQAKLVVDKIIEVVQKDPATHYNFLIDLTKTGTIHYISDEAKQAYMQLPKYTNFKKAAIVGKSLFLEVTINLIMQAVGRGNSFKIFEDEKEARDWLGKD